MRWSERAGGFVTKAESMGEGYNERMKMSEQVEGDESGGKERAALEGLRWCAGVRGIDMVCLEVGSEEE